MYLHVFLISYNRLAELKWPAFQLFCTEFVQNCNCTDIKFVNCVDSVKIHCRHHHPRVRCHANQRLAISQCSFCRTVYSDVRLRQSCRRQHFDEPVWNRWRHLYTRGWSVSGKGVLISPPTSAWPVSPPRVTSPCNPRLFYQPHPTHYYLLGRSFVWPTFSPYRDGDISRMKQRVTCRLRSRLIPFFYRLPSLMPEAAPLSIHRSHSRESVTRRFI